MSKTSVVRTVGSVIAIGATLAVVINQLVSRGVLDEPGEIKYYCGLCQVGWLEVAPELGVVAILTFTASLIISFPKRIPRERDDE